MPRSGSCIILETTLTFAVSTHSCMAKKKKRSSSNSSGQKTTPPVEPHAPQERVSIIRLIRNRIIAGLFVVLPIYITYAVLKWLYDTLYSIALAPILAWLRELWDLPDPPQDAVAGGAVVNGGAVETAADVFQPTAWALSFGLSLVALFLVCAVLYVAGMFFRSRLHHAVNWILQKVPGVNTVYSAVNKVFDALSNTSQDARQFKRVVLVPFPHTGMKAPAFVTGECIEESTNQIILCVYVPTTPVPTSGYMLLIPQEDVVDLNWDLEETLQAIVSGGITVPSTVTYFRSGPVVDSGSLPNTPATITAQSSNVTKMAPPQKKQ